MKSLRRISTSFIAVFLLAAAAWAQDQPAQDQSAQSDPPGRVARLQYLSGQVSVQPQGTGDWVGGDTNRPLTNGDNVWADKDSRAELSFGTARARIDAMSSLTLTNISDNAVQLSLHQGVLNVSIRRLEDGEVYEIDTPNIAFTVAKPGDYRFDVDPNGDTTLATVWKGEGDATGSGPAVHISSGQQVSFTGGTSLQHEVRQAPQPDGFDQWCQLRDKSEERSASARYVNPGVVGADDLDEYGTWNETPDYGPVWVPTAVAPGWAPYGYGQWTWVAPWGWTWVDAYPWGFAPFHYGRWVWWNGGWGWAPGPYWYRPWYAPALVAWWGGPHWGVGFGFGFGFGGGFGWCPLGWREPFYPWYHVSPYYFRNINIRNTRITNITNISNTYFRNGGRTPLYGRNGFGMPRFATSHNALTAMSRNNLERGMPVRGNSVRVSPAQFRGASALGRLEANPSRQAVLGARAGETAARPSQSAFSRPTISRMTPPARAQSPLGNQATRNTGIASPRNEGTAMSRGSETASARMPQRQGNATATPGSAGRSVPRPPQSFRNPPAATGRGPSGSASPSRNVPRPPSASTGRSRGESEMAMNRNVPSFSNPRTPALSSPSSRSVPRPPEGMANRPNTSARANVPGRSSGSYGASRGAYNVPRPSGPVQPAPRNYYGSGSRGGYSNRAYGGYPSGAYGSSRFGGFPSSGHSYAAPSRSYGSYGGYRGSYGGFHGSSGGSGFHGSSGGFHGSSGGGGGHGGGRR